MPTANADLRITGQGEVAEILQAFSSVGFQLQQMKNRLDDVDAKAKKTSNTISKMFTKMSATIERNAKRVAMAFGAGVIGVMVKSVKSAQEFETALASVSTLLGEDVPAKMAKFKTAILEISKTTGESATVLSSSLFTIISATVKGSESVEGANKLLAATSKLAIAGFTDTATATEALTTVLNSYNLGAEDAVEVSDKLTKIAALANTTFGAMAPELGKVASITAAAGVSIDELGFMFASLTAGGRKVNMAMTDMRAIINGLTKPSDALTKIYEKMGIKSGAAAIKQMGVVKVLEMIKKETGGTFENIQKVIEQQEAWAGAAILLGERLGSANEVVGQIRDSAGATEEAFKKMSDTFAFKSNLFKTKVNEVFIRIGDKILPVLSENLDKLSAWVDKNSDEIVEFFKKAFDTIVGFGKFILEHGKEIAVALGAIWATGKITAFVASVGGAKKALSSLGKFGLLGFALWGAGGISDFIVKMDERMKSAERFRDDLFAMFAHPFTKLTKIKQEYTQGYAKGYSPEDKTAKSDANALLSKEQEKARLEAIKRRAAALQLLHSIEVSGMNEIDALYAKRAETLKKVTEAQLSPEERAAAEKVINEKYLADKLAIEKKIADERGAAQDKILKREAEAAKKRGDLLAYADEKSKKAAEDYVAVRKDALENEVRIREGLAQLEIDNLKEWIADPENKIFNMAGRGIVDSVIEASPAVAEVLGDAVGGALETVWEGLKNVGKAFLSMFSGLYEKAYNQLKELLNKSFEAAAEGNKQLVLTSADRARMEQEMGRALTADEARARATAYSPTELASLQQQGRIGDYSVVGTETPQNRMEEVLATMQSWWQNMADNLGPILDWLTDVAGPALIDSIVENIPKIIDSLNESWMKTLPKMAEEVIPMIVSLVSDELPSIINALITGIIEAMTKIGENIIPMATDLIRGIVLLITQLTTNMFVQLPVMLIRSMVQAIRDVFTKKFWKDIFQDMVVAIWEGFKEIFHNLKKALSPKGAFKKAGKKIKSWFHDGGMIGDNLQGMGAAFHGAIRAHQGMSISPELAADEVPIIAQTGEAVLSRQGVAAAGGEQGVAALNGGGGNQTNVYFSPGYVLAKDAPDLLDTLLGSVVSAGRGKMAANLRAGKVAGFKSKRS